MEPEGSLSPPQAILILIDPVYAPQPNTLRSILILFFHLSLDIQRGLLWGFPTKNLYTPLFSTINATCLIHLIDHPNGV